MQYFIRNFIGSEYKVKTKIIAVDFTDGDSIYSTVRKELATVHIGILVNNVGMASMPEEFYKTSDQDWHNMINCNAMSMVRLSHIVLPQMVQRKKGVIVNIGSIASVMPAIFFPVYGATKVKWNSALMHTIRHTAIAKHFGN